MDAADADPNGGRKLSLGHIRIILEKAQYTEPHVLLQGIALAGHQRAGPSTATAQGLPAARLGATGSNMSNGTDMVVQS
ncbi:hypothetical protein STA1M1_31090 [Sinisalibacter aestuarii]|uniref:Uncharacterized protein n=1 Tax=Sinisalibacter aestuarii TaxID=2949426 RepID=A0ABQ5LW67_9RHOB|nr:hypothetical protein STA1M1_31090 [Sinisalibacter aestuarii]